MNDSRIPSSDAKPPSGADPRPPGTTRLLRLAWALSGGILATAILTWATIQRPSTFGLACLAIAILLYTQRHGIQAPVLRIRPDRVYLAAIAGAILGEFLGHLFFHLNPEAPKSLGWLVLGALGIGGACGVTVGALAILSLTGFSGGWLLWQVLVTSRRRAA